MREANRGVLTVRNVFQEAKARNCDAISNALSFTNDIGTEEESPVEDDTEAEAEQQALAL